MPNGLVLVDLKTKDVLLANREMETLVNFEEGSKGAQTFKDKLCNFFMLP